MLLSFNYILKHHTSWKSAGQEGTGFFRQRLSSARHPYELCAWIYPYQERMVSHLLLGKLYLSYGNWDRSRRSLTKGQKENWIDAVQCLHGKPSIFNGKVAGLRSRYDDFQYEHIVQAFNIHLNVRLVLSVEVILFWSLADAISGSISCLASMVFMDIWKSPSRRVRLSRLPSVSSA